MPQVYQGPRAIILLLLLLTTFQPIIKVHLNKDVRFFWMATYCVAVYAFIIGALRGNAGVIPCSPFYLVWPVLFLYFIIRCNTLDRIKYLLRIVIYGGLTVAVFNFILIVNAFVLHIGILNSIGDALSCMFNIEEGFAEYFSPSGNHLPYILYFCVSLLLLKPETLSVPRKHLYICIAVSVIDILLSNRRAMWLVVAMLPVILISVMALLPYHKKSILKVSIITIVTGILVFGIMYYFLDLDYVIREFVSSFDFSGAEGSNLERTLQGKSLWKDFKERPILGSGLGHVSAYIRTPEAPWGYELTYNYSLAAVGFVGFSVYTLATTWIYLKSIRLSQKNIEYASLLIPQILGLFALLVISFSNPYICTFDFVWTIYLPVATINAIWNEQRKAKANLCIS